MDNNPERCVATSPTRARLQIGCKFFNDNTEIIGKPDSMFQRPSDTGEA